VVFLKILLGIVIFFVILCALPLRVRIRLEETFTLMAGIGPLVLFRMPGKKKTVRLRDFTYEKHQKRLAKDRAARLKKRQKKQQSAAKKEQKKNAAAKASELKEAAAAAHKKENKLEGILSLVSCVLDALPGFFGAFKCRIYRLDITAGGKDAAEAARNFGILSQSTAFLLEFLDNKTHFVPPKADTVAVRVDFLAEKNRFQADLYLQIRVGQILGTVFAILIPYVKSLIHA